MEGEKTVAPGVPTVAQQDRRHLGSSGLIPSPEQWVEDLELPQLHAA